jgi:hypothetical protein
LRYKIKQALKVPVFGYKLKENRNFQKEQVIQLEIFGKQWKKRALLII